MNRLLELSKQMARQQNALICAKNDIDERRAIKHTLSIVCLGIAELLKEASVCEDVNE